MSEVIFLDGEDQEDGLTAGKVLRGALEDTLAEVLVIGRTDEGAWYYATSDPDIPAMIYAAERFKNYILQFEKGRIVG